MNPSAVDEVRSPRRASVCSCVCVYCVPVHRDVSVVFGVKDMC